MHSIRSVLHSGNGGIIVEAECSMSNGLPAIIIVGLGNKAIEESKERIRSAFAGSSLSLPRKRITVNLAPADIPKDSTSLDLAIATTILLQSDQFPQLPGTDTAFIGEVGLGGDVRAVRGIIGKLLAGKQRGITTFYIPRANLDQALLVPDVCIVPIPTLRSLFLALNGQEPITPIQSQTCEPSLKNLLSNTASNASPTIDDIIGQEQAKRAIEIAAAGGHNIFLSGAPGTGKSMLAKALVSILPPLTVSEVLDITHLHSLINDDYNTLVTARPFRAPHHSASHVSIVGGGNNLRPGEISLSHHGVLFLDELPEFNRATLEALRQPLEDGAITIARAKTSLVYPASFMLVGTANPCPCGFHGTSKPCECSAATVLRYQRRVSGPILDRVDLHVFMEGVDHAKLLQSNVGRQTKRIAKRVQEARAAQVQRFRKYPNVQLNAHMTNAHAKAYANLASGAQAVLNQAAQSLDLSARGYMRAVKVARTIADLAGSPMICPEHITEALQYRQRSGPV